MNRVATAALLCLLALPARADFDSVVRAIEAAHDTRASGIPLFGLGRALVRATHPDGVLDVRLARFDVKRFGDVSRVAATIAKSAGPGYQQIISTSSARSGEWAVIFARPLPKDRATVLVFSSDSEDTVLLQMDLDAKAFAGLARGERKVGTGIR